MNKFLCRVLGHIFEKGELGITQVNTCTRCNHEVKLVEEGVKVPNYGSK